MRFDYGGYNSGFRRFAKGIGYVYGAAQNLYNSNYAGRVFNYVTKPYVLYRAGRYAYNSIRPEHPHIRGGIYGHSWPRGKKRFIRKKYRRL